MTEREYVETIRKAAEEYVTRMRLNKPFLGALNDWSEVKLRLSPDTAISLCDAWLTMQETVE